MGKRKGTVAEALADERQKMRAKLRRMELEGGCVGYLDAVSEMKTFVKELDERAAKRPGGAVKGKGK